VEHQFVCDNIVKVRRGSTRRLAMTLIGGGLVLLLGISLLGGLAALLGYFVLVGGVVTLLHQRTHPITIPLNGGYPGSVAITESTITIEGGGPVAVPRAALVQGWIAPSPAGPNVVLETKEGDAYAIQMASLEEADALLDAAGVSAERRIVTMRVAPPTQNPGLGCVVLAATVVLTPVFVGAATSLVGPFANPSMEAFFTIVFIGLFALVIAELSSPPVLTVGLDGLRLRTLLRSRYVPHTKILDLADSESGATLLLEGNKRLKLAAMRTRGRADAVDGLRALLRRALSASFRRRSSSRAAEALDRRGERFDDWKARLAKLTSSLGYREGSLDAEALADVVDDAQSPVDRRLGAALALAKAGGEAGKARVRIAAEATADVELRAALEAAAEQELTDEMATRVITRRG
jgi:hypothetical protein